MGLLETPRSLLKIGMGPLKSPHSWDGRSPQNMGWSPQKSPQNWGWSLGYHSAPVPPQGLLPRVLQPQCPLRACPQPRCHLESPGCPCHPARSHGAVSQLPAPVTNHCIPRGNLGMCSWSLSKTWTETLRTALPLPPKLGMGTTGPPQNLPKTGDRNQTSSLKFGQEPQRPPKSLPRVGGGNYRTPQKNLSGIWDGSPRDPWHGSFPGYSQGDLCPAEHNLLLFSPWQRAQRVPAHPRKPWEWGICTEQ